MSYDKYFLELLSCLIWYEDVSGDVNAVLCACRDLKELGITKIGHIKRIQQGIREIKESKSHS